MYQRIGNMPKACPYVMMRPPIVADINHLSCKRDSGIFIFALTDNQTSDDWFFAEGERYSSTEPRVDSTLCTYHQAALNRSAIFACMVFRIMRHLRCRWLQISFLVGFYIYFAQIGAFSRKIIIFAKARLSISLKY